MPVVVKVRRWGNSLGLRLPKSFTVAQSIVDGTTVRIDGLEVVDAPPRRRSRHKLKDVLQSYTKLPKQLDFPPLGREIL